MFVGYLMTSHQNHENQRHMSASTKTQSMALFSTFSSEIVVVTQQSPIALHMRATNS